ncbi:hypothetical protein OE88DRAFT_1723849 [Heliocybe sulcata]|uniref:FK506-binding protein n=1 Tax=Heliocybe sulcata TaxID=5364 RepID=A0A5C3N8B8_9AGAM|nr:hypothetical protein OE88DRAFT_1723849 [Heliocybe sulcata]
MSIAIAVWSTVLKPGQKESVVPLSDLRITNAALGSELVSQDKRTSIKVTYQTAANLEDDESDDEEPPSPISETILCSLTPGKIEQATFDLILEQELEYEFEVVGPNTVYLTGNYIDQNTNNVPFNDESEPDSDEEDFDLRDVSSDVEIDPSELDVPSDQDADRFEEIQDEEEQPAAKGGKRPRESDVMETDEQPQEKLSKSAKKKLNKKLKTEGGKAVPVGDEPPSSVKPEEKKSKKDGKQDKADQKAKSAGGETQTLEGGLKIRDVKIGNGPKVKKGSQVSMRYIGNSTARKLPQNMLTFRADAGKLQNGTIFDKNTKGQPFTTTIGKGEVIKGWDVGIQGMQVGGERLLIVPPGMGYGNKKMGTIPANSTLTFEVKLISLK